MEEARELLAKAFAHTMDEGEAELALRKSISKVTLWRDKIQVELEGGGQIELPVKRIGKSRELPMPLADFIEKKDGSYQYQVTWSFERLSPDAKNEPGLCMSIQVEKWSSKSCERKKAPSLLEAADE